MKAAGILTLMVLVVLFVAARALVWLAKREQVRREAEDFRRRLDEWEKTGWDDVDRW